MHSFTWIHDKYDQLVKDYAGKYILFDEKEVLFADESFTVVYEQYKKLRTKKECKMTLVDEGEATLYGFRI